MKSEPETKNENQIENPEQENMEENEAVLDDDYLLHLHQYLQEMKKQA